MTETTLHVCHLLGSLGSGGRESLLLDIMKHTPEDVDHSLCCFKSTDGTATRFESLGTSVRAFDVGSPTDYRQLLGLFNHLRRSDIDVLHIHGPRAQVPGRLLGRIGGVSAIVSTHHGVREMFPRRIQKYERATRWLDSVTIAVSEGVRRSYVDETSTDGWRTIHNGIDVDAFHTAVQGADPESVRDRHDLDDEMILLNVGRYVPPKAQLDLIEAMEIADEDLPSSRLFIVGGRGAMEDRLRNAVRERNLDDVVSVTGHVEDIDSYYAAADVFVSSSIQEGLPIVLLEAMAAKLPVIATAIPGVKELVNNGTSGVLVPPGRPDQLAREIDRMSDPAVRTPFAAAGYRRVRDQFDIGQTAAGYHSVYRELTEDGR